MTIKKKDNFKTISDKAQQYIDHGAPKPISEMTIEEIPPVAISWGRSDVFKTGAWRNVTPHYVKRLPPCRAGCPVGNDIEGWLVAAGKGDWDEAVGLLMAEQPLPSVCGRVCYHPCETVCNRGDYDGSVNIRAVERFLGDRIVESGLLPDIQTDSSARVLIVGSGPTGLSAAWMLRRLGHEVEIRERAAEPGGLLRYGIPAYRMPRDILASEIELLERLGVSIRCGVDSVQDNISNLKGDFDALFLSPGAAGHRSSGISGATEGTVVGAIEFLAQVADKIPPLPLPTIADGDKVVVIGGGNSAIDAARTALRLGAEVTILYRRTRSEMPAYHEEIEAAIAEGVKIEFLISPDSLIAGGRKRLRCIRNKLGKPDASGRRRPEPMPGSEFELSCDTILDAVGEYPDPSQLTADTNEAELLRSADVWGRTKFDGVFTGGDFSGGDRTVAHAIGAGKRAAMAINQYLKGDDAQSLDRYLLDKDGAVTANGYQNQDSVGYDRKNLVRLDDLNTAYHPHLGRIEETETDSKIRVSNFDEIVSGLTEQMNLLEAGRCFHCGECDDCGNCHVFCPDGAVVRDPNSRTLSFDLEHCKGCGICEAECPRAAIEMKK